MKCAGCRCSFGVGLVLGTILLSAVALTAQQTPAVMPSLLSPRVPLRATILLETPGPASTVTDKLAQLDKEVKAAQSSADNAWMLVSAALVLMMTGPGLALFYGGLVRRKNTLASLIQMFALMAVIMGIRALGRYRLGVVGRRPA